MSNVNYSIQEMTHLALGIIFIISVVAANCLLIISLIRQHRAIFAVRTAVLLSLVVGDIMLALFSLVIDLLGENNIKCNSTFFSRVYRDYMLQFVYSLGLLMLALCLMVAYKRFEQQQQLHIQQQHVTALNGVDSSGHRAGLDNGESKTLTLGLALICSGVPWLVALIVILPLTAPRLTMCYAHSEVSREIIYIWACVVLPASLTLLVSAGVATVLKTRQEHFPKVATDYGPGVVDSVEAFPLQTSSAFGAGPENTTAVTAVDDVTDRSVDGQPHAAESTSASPLYPDPTFEQQQTLESATANDSVVRTPESHLGNPNSDRLMTSNFKRQKSALLVVAIVHFVCVIPNAVFALTFAYNPELHNDIDHVMFAVLSDLCKWLVVLRSVLAPLSWIGFLKS
ncbi:hypothetical protein ElyMa_005932800 [Elysia marginata]|uniref:G-protein coupled receptors family 1 profile domain-containing protein n=1 Tax=Elysia marginata TaxID=1093978 RepID=A0AAV4GAP0_9GAST|nr:hypothetical protein ElyMa_005932800 [Elysia marginata]